MDRVLGRQLPPERAAVEQHSGREIGEPRQRQQRVNPAPAEAGDGELLRLDVRLRRQVAGALLQARQKSAVARVPLVRHPVVGDRRETLAREPHRRVPEVVVRRSEARVEHDQGRESAGHIGPGDPRLHLPAVAGHHDLRGHDRVSCRHAQTPRCDRGMGCWYRPRVVAAA